MLTSRYHTPLLSLPMVTQASLNVKSVDWNGLPTRYFNPGELEVLIALMRLVPDPLAKVVVEIGVNEGRTAKAVLRELPYIEHYMGVDVEPGYIPRCAVQRGEIPRHPGLLVRAEPRFSLMIARRGSFDFGPANFGPVNIFFIDGDHGREAVQHDTELAFATVQPGGIIIWHDYKNDGFTEVHEVLEPIQAKGVDIKYVEDTWLAYTRVRM